MSKQTLPTNYKNTEYASGTTIQKFNMIQNSDGTVSFEDVTDYSQVGSTFGADELNATNEAVNASADKSDILDSAVAINANTTNGKMAGAYGVKELLIGGLSPVTFTRASSRSNIASGETLATLFGKISKWFADLGYAAFRNVANNLTTSSAGSLLLDAYQGKVLNDKITTINSNLTDISDKLPNLIQRKIKSQSYTVSGNSVYTNNSITPDTVDGYTPVFAYIRGTGSRWVYPYFCDVIGSGKIQIEMKNTGSSSVSSTVNINVIYLRDF